MEINFSKFQDRILLISLSWAFVIVSQILGADLSDSGVASRYNLVVKSVALESSLKQTKKNVNEWQKIRKKNISIKKKNYIVQEFDEDVQGKGIPNRVFIHFGLAHLVVGHENEVLDLLKLRFPKCTNTE